MRLEQDQSTHPRLLRKSAFGEVSDDKAIKVAKKPKKAKGSRFVGPTQLNDDQRSRIGNALEQKGVGDETGREIFICAVEYQMSAFGPRLERRAEPASESENGAPDAAAKAALRSLVESAANLSRLLQTLPDEAQGRVTEMLAREAGLWRGYDGRYLCELGLEIDRLERACIAAGGEPEPAEPEPLPKSDPAVSRELVAKLAKIFSECFEMEATAEEQGPFYASLDVVAEVTGLAIEHAPAFLAQVLSGPALKGEGGRSARG